MELSKVIPLVVGSLTIVGGLIGGATWIDSRYAHHTELVQLAQSVDRRSIENQLATYKLELQALRAKPTLSAEELDRIAYLVKVISLLQQQLDGIVGGA